MAEPTLTPELEELRNTAIANLPNSYCVYSDFPVSAALADVDGTIYTGVSVENASFPCGWCAEISAFAKAVSAGAREFTGLAIAVNRDAFASPCGHCRQAIFEFCYGKHTPLLLVNKKGEFYLTTIEDIHVMDFQKTSMDK